MGLLMRWFCSFVSALDDWLLKKYTYNEVADGLLQCSGNIEDVNPISRNP